MITIGLYGIADTSHSTGPTYTHDHGVALMRDGVVLTTVQLERWTGIKRDNRLGEFIGDVLGALLPVDEPVRFVCVNSFVGSSFISHDGNLRIEPNAPVTVADVLIPARVRWYPDGLTPRSAEAYIMCQEFAHLAALLPFVGSFEPNALLVHVDGGASDSACSFWQMTANGPRLLESSWDKLKAPINNFNVNPLVRAILGFETDEHLSIPGKLMGYAAWGEAEAEMEQWLAKQGWFLAYKGNTASLLEMINRRFGTSHTHFDPRARLFQNLCACIQHYFESELVKAIIEAQHRTGATVLYYAGGGALNIPTNTLLERHFDKVYVPPCPNDSGLALGAAAWLEHTTNSSLPWHSPFLERYDTPNSPPSLQDVEASADLLASGHIIGVCNGAGEVGPRALGHRSLLARADDPKLRQRLSEDIKGREWYRPLAPVISHTLATDILGFEVADSALAPWMLGSWQVRDEWRAAFAGVIHADGSVRAQVVRDEHQDDAWLSALLMCLWERHRLPGLINTSFNVRGAPILQRHADAMDAAANMNLDGVVIHGALHRF